MIYCYHYIYLRLSLFSDINVSQGSVATLVRCGEIFKADFLQFTDESVSERIMKIGRYRTKLS